MTVPTPTAQRIEALDVLRGVAVLGILLLNINSFALPLDAIETLYTTGYENAIDAVVFSVVSVLGQGKFMALFSLMFGAGVSMMVDRRLQRGEPAAGLHYRRMGVLAAIGFIHGVFIWYGDILLFYALAGSVLYPILKLSNRALIRFAIGAWALTLLSSLGLGLLLAMVDSTSTEGQNTSLIFHNEVELMRGGVLGIMKVRFVHWLVILLFAPFLILPWVLSLMLTGAAACRAGWVTGERSMRAYRILLIVGLAIGLPLAVLRTTLILTRADQAALSLGMFLNYAEAAAVGAAWLSLVMLIVKADLLAALRRRLAAVGQMALTNYLAQSVLCTMLFYGYGFGLFGSLSRSALLGVVAGVWLLQLLWSPWWLARNQRGPMEAIWRRLTYPKRTVEPVYIPREP